jgi:hypothetical protein
MAAFHDDEARAAQMLNQALVDHLRHELIGVMLAKPHNASGGSTVVCIVWQTKRHQ